MKCPYCGYKNKSKVRFCTQCGKDLKSKKVEKPFKKSESKIVPEEKTEQVQLEVWQPTWKWHLKILGIIYAFLGICYWIMKIILKRFA